MNYGRYLENNNGCELLFGINDYFFFVWSSGVSGVLVGLKIQRSLFDSRLFHKFTLMLPSYNGYYA